MTGLVRHDTDLWSTEHEFGWQGGLVRIPVRMTVIRLRSGELILHSPVPISPELRAELDALGPVGFIVVPRAHGRFAEQAAQSFPSARLLAAPSPSRRRKSLPFRGSLADQPPAAWDGQVESLLLLGFPLHEVVLFHRPSRTLVITDLCFNIQRASSRVARLFFRANDMWQRFGPSRIIRTIGVSNRAAFRGSLERVLRWDFERIVPGHGDVVERGGPAALRAAWSIPRNVSSPSGAADQRTREEWRELGFYYDTVKEPPAWRIVGSRSGLARFAVLLEDYLRDPRNAASSEHEHYGPYMYLKITTWSRPEIDGDGIRGSLADLERLRDLVRAKLSEAAVGDSFVVAGEYAEQVAYPLRFEVRDDRFDPAEEDSQLAPAG